MAAVPPSRVEKNGKIAKAISTARANEPYQAGCYRGRRWTSPGACARYAADATLARLAAAARLLGECRRGRFTPRGPAWDMIAGPDDAERRVPWGAGRAL